MSAPCGAETVVTDTHAHTGACIAGWELVEMTELANVLLKSVQISLWINVTALECNADVRTFHTSAEKLKEKKTQYKSLFRQLVLYRC